MTFKFSSFPRILLCYKAVSLIYYIEQGKRKDRKKSKAINTASFEGFWYYYYFFGDGYSKKSEKLLR